MGVKNKGFTREDFLAFAKKEYGSQPEYLWMSDPTSCVLRHKDNNKWYAVIMRVGRERLGLKGSGSIDIAGIKCDPLLKEALLGEAGVLPAYHINKRGWITLLLDGSCEADIAIGCMKMSFDLTKPKTGRSRTEPRRWIIPANPKICDLEDVFDEDGNIYWTQSARFIVGDTVFIYVGAPVSEVRYECKVTGIDIDFDFGTDMISGKKAVRLKLIRRFGRGELTRERLSELGVTNIRGPRGVPHSIDVILDAIE